MSSFYNYGNDNDDPDLPAGSVTGTEEEYEDNSVAPTDLPDSGKRKPGMMIRKGGGTESKEEREAKKRQREVEREERAEERRDRQRQADLETYGEDSAIFQNKWDDSFYDRVPDAPKVEAPGEQEVYSDDPLPPINSPLSEFQANLCVNGVMKTVIINGRL